VALLLAGLDDALEVLIDDLQVRGVAGDGRVVVEQAGDGGDEPVQHVAGGVEVGGAADDEQAEQQRAAWRRCRGRRALPPRRQRRTG
jgi:hypothetical protein